MYIEREIVVLVDCSNCIFNVPHHFVTASLPPISNSYTPIVLIGLGNPRAFSMDQLGHRVYLVLTNFDGDNIQSISMMFLFCLVDSRESLRDQLLDVF